MRLDKFISNHSEYSRTDVKRLIKAQRVTLNSLPATKAEVKIKPDSDTVQIDGNTISTIPSLYLMLNKPKGVVCANTDSEHPTVIDIIKKNAHRLTPSQQLKIDTLQIAGRLDLDTTGLVFLTTDGKWNQRVTSPSQNAKKTYRVALTQDINPTAEQLFREGIKLNNENKLTRPALLEIINPKEVMLSIGEGKYHQVKRMFAAIGNHVCALHRVSIAGVHLDEDLDEGEFRALTATELTQISKHLEKAEQYE